MSHTIYIPDTNHITADTEQAKHVVVGVGPARTDEGIRGVPWATDEVGVGALLHRVAAGILGGVCTRGFGADIDAGNHRLGNRAFLRWVVELRGSGQSAQSSAEEMVVGPMPPPASRVAMAGPLQLMPKKKKKKTVATVEEVSEVTTKASGGAGPGADVGTAPVVAGDEPPVPLPGSEDTPVLAQFEESAVVGEKKKKKKSRVQVALNTLRGEGVEAFKSYIDTEIREAELLRTLTERIRRADDLRRNREETMKMVEARLRVLDPEAVAGAPEAAVPGPGQGRERPDIAPVKTELSPRELELFGCCVSGDVRKFKRLLRYGKIDINMGSKVGTPLGLASFYGHAGIIRELLSMPDIDVNLAHDNGMTPLYFAAQGGHAEVVSLLLAAPGINVNLLAHTGATSLYAAAHYGYMEVVKLLLAAPGINVNPAAVGGVTPLYIAAQKGRVEVVKLLLAAPGINVNSAEMEGTTPLCIAAQVGQEEVVELLLDAPAIRIDARKADGATALFGAAQDNFPRIAELLIKRGANVNVTLKSGTAALDIAAQRGHVEVVRVLLQAPAIEVNHVTKSAITALAMACAEGHQDVVTLLLEKGAYPNITLESKIAPLHLACLRGHTAIVRILLNAGVNMDDGIAVETADAGTISFTPYGIAELMGHRDIMTLLEQHRQARAVRAMQVETLSPEDGPGRSSPSTAAPEPASLPVAAPAVQTEQIPLPSPAAAESRATGGMEPAEPPSPLALGKHELVQEILRKLEQDNLEPLQGIRLLVEVRASASIDGLCGIYNRLAHIERRSERARRRGGRRRESAVEVEAVQEAGRAASFALGEKADMDADAVEDEIKHYLGQAHHRFVSQAVNDMEFGRGKPTTGYPGLWHVSAGISGVGSCSVFYYGNEKMQQIRIAGIGHHVGRAAYRLDYADEDLGDSKRTLRIA